MAGAGCAHHRPRGRESPAEIDEKATTMLSFCPRLLRDFSSGTSLSGASTWSPRASGQMGVPWAFAVNMSIASLVSSAGAAIGMLVDAVARAASPDGSPQSSAIATKRGPIWTRPLPCVACRGCSLRAISRTLSPLFRPGSMPRLSSRVSLGWALCEAIAPASRPFSFSFLPSCSSDSGVARFGPPGGAVS